jgi:hypothetical protein
LPIEPKEKERRSASPINREGLKREEGKESSEEHCE